MVKITDESGKIHVLPGIPIPKTQSGREATEKKIRAWAENRGIKVAKLEHN
jgi:hypothetical protein